MAPAPSSPWDCLTRMMDVDPAAPRITFYEQTPGPTRGERIELSGKVLTNWVSKAANFLVDECDVEAGSRLAIALPAAHWRTVYWCFAAWAVGAHVTFFDTDVEGAVDLAAATLTDIDVLVTNDAALAAALPASDLIFVTLAALARSASGDLPAGAFDEAQEISNFGDVFSPFAPPAAGETALTMVAETVGQSLAGASTHEEATKSPSSIPTASAPPPTTSSAAASSSKTWSFGELCVSDQGILESARVFLDQPNPASVCRIFAANGSVVIIRGQVEHDALARILEQESAERV